MVATRSRTQVETRIFTCNQMDFPYEEVQSEIEDAKSLLAKGEPHISGWTCAKIQSICVHDKAYFYRVGAQPCGFFACGIIVPEDREYQIKKNRSSDFGHLSLAYSDSHYDENYRKLSKDTVLDEYGLAIKYRWFSVVDYDKPLAGKLLKSMPEFNGYKFLFRQSGQAFGESFTSKHLQLLDELWKEHVTKLEKQGHGIYLPLPVL